MSIKYTTDQKYMYMLSMVLLLNFRKLSLQQLSGLPVQAKQLFLTSSAGLICLLQAKIIIDGTDLSKLKSSQLIDFRMRNIGFVFQAYNLIPVLTAKENVEFIMNLQKWSRKERDERTFEL